MSLRLWRQLDLPLLMAMIALIGLGLALIYSATATGVELSFYDHPSVRQGLYALLGFGLLIFIASVDYRLLSRFAPLLYVLMLGALGAVLLIGRAAYGAKRWIDLPFIQFQPSEMAKVVMIIVLAKVLADRQDSIKSFRTFAITVLLTAPPVGLIFLQPDVGTVLMIGAIWLGLVIMGGVAFRWLAIIALIGALALPVVYDIALHSYMRDRIENFMNPDKDPLGSGYNVIQAEISVGSGGLLGKGYLRGSQTQLNYLRVQSTDFIFSVLGEEFGFVGALTVFLLFAIMLFRALDVAGNSRDVFGRLIITGVVITILIQTFINVGVNIRLLPVTGIPLPFVSSGGTALLTFMIALGLVQSVAMRRLRS